MNYRRDIDGLRAIAIIFVLVFHGTENILRSGFIGVDIFFVISGYLISSIILRSLETDSFSFSEFYRKRLWRLQPALIAVMFFTLIIATVFYLPADFIQFARSAKYTSFLISNQFFERITTSYSAPDAKHLLLLHTWSLSIEWQWYLILPIALTVLTKLRHPKTVITIAVVISLGVMLYFSQIKPAENYYYFICRVFELAIGSCVAVFKLDKIKINKITSSVLGLTSIIALIYISLQENIIFGFPNVNAVFISLLTATIIIAGTNNHGLATVLLSFPPIVYIGKMSYSLYLWHWPIFAVYSYLDLPKIYQYIFSLYIFIFLISYLSYRFIERPLRKSKISITKSVITIVIIPIIVFSLISTFVIKNNGISSRFNYGDINTLSLLEQYESKIRPTCSSGNTDGKDDKCRVGEMNNPHKLALLMGDSHSNHLWGFFDMLGKDSGTNIILHSTGTCLTLPKIHLFNWWKFRNEVYKECYDNTQQYYQNIKKYNFDYVIISQVWNNYTNNNVINDVGDEISVNASRKRIEKSIREALDIIIESGAKPIFVKTVYNMPTDYMACFNNYIKFRKTYITEACNRSNHYQGDDSNEWFSQLFEVLQKEYPNLLVIDPKKVQCTSGKCMTDINGVPVYRDVGHITDYASYYFGNEYLKKYGNPLK